MEYLLTHEQWLRLGFSLGGLFLFLLLGMYFPYRVCTAFKNRQRRTANITIAISNALIIKSLGFLGLVSLSQFANKNGAGLFNLLEWNFILEFVIGFVLFDMVIYWQHRMTHIVPLLWRLHRVHHTDVEMDATTAIRFHPLEIIFSYAIKLMVIYCLGLSAETVILFEIVLNFSALFQHGNYSLPIALEAVTRRFIITPCMHRIHHSVVVEETNSNYGFFLSIWDRLFGSYCHRSVHDPRTMLIGLEEFRSSDQQKILPLLFQPLSVRKS